MINREKYPDYPVYTVDELLEKDEFGIDFSSEIWSVAKFLDRPSLFLFDDPIQRGVKAWSAKKASEAIASILMNIDLGPIKIQKKYVKEHKKTYKNVIDGAQRMTKVRDYVRNLWSTVDETYIFGEVKGQTVLIDISNKCFKELPEIFQNRIKGFTFELHMYDIDDNMKRELFYRWNNMEPLNDMEMNRANMTDDMLAVTSSIMKMDFLQIGYKEKHSNRSLHLEPILQAMALIETDNNTAISKNAIWEMLVRNKIKPATVDSIQAAGSYLNEVYALIEEKLRKKVFHKNFKASIMYIAHYAVREGREESAFAAWLSTFYGEEIKKTEFFYHSGFANLVKVQKRHGIPLQHYRSYFGA